MELTRQEKVQLFNDAVKRTKKPQRVPLYCAAGNYKIAVSEYKMAEAFDDYEIISDLLIGFQDKFHYDAYQDCTVGMRNPLRFIKAVNLTGHYVDEERKAIVAPDNGLMVMEDYDYDIILEKGFNNWRLENYLPRKIKKESLEEIEQYIEAGMKELFSMFAANGKLTQRLMDNNILQMNISIATAPPCDIMSWYRGIKGFGIDLRRKKDKIGDVFKIIWEETSAYAKGTVNADNPDNIAAFNHFMCTLSNAVLNAKQFEQYLWPYMKQVVDYAKDHDQTFLVFSEADALRFKDCYGDVPVGTMALMVEMDSVFDVKKQLPNVTPVGGYPIELLQRGTKEECIDMGKKIMDEVAYDGAYVYTEKKMLTFPNDADPERLKWVVDFFREQRF